MKLMDMLYLKHPEYGKRRVCAYLNHFDDDDFPGDVSIVDLNDQDQMIWREEVEKPFNIKRIQRLLRLSGLEAIYPKPSLSKPDRHVSDKYPYLLKGLDIDRSNIVWSTDITYIPLRRGFIYLVAVLTGLVVMCYLGSCQTL
jgi:hypothetical protein